jgi:hypothetical protein
MISDIYQLGCVFYELIFRKCYYIERESDKPFEKPSFKTAHNILIDLIKSMLSEKKCDRPKIN